MPLALGFSFFKAPPYWDFTGILVVKTSPSNAGGVGTIPGHGAKVPHDWGQNKQTNKTYNRISVVTNSINTFQMLHIKKILKKEEPLYCF